MSNRSKMTPEEVAALLEGAGVPKSVLFYVILGGISRLRAVVHDAAARGGMAEAVSVSHFADVQSGSEFPSPIQKDEFIYSSPAHDPLRVVNWGLPSGKSKLEVPTKGLTIRLPHPVEWVKVRGAHYADTDVMLHACRDQDVLCSSSAHPNGEAIYTLMVKADQINRVLLTANGGESLFINITIPKANGNS